MFQCFLAMNGTNNFRNLISKPEMGSPKFFGKPEMGSPKYLAKYSGKPEKGSPKIRESRKSGNPEMGTLNLNF